MDKIFKGYILVSDMDGTLINSLKRVSKKNKDAIKYFVDNGGLFTLATGRMLQSVRGFVEELDIKCPVLLHSGAKIYDFQKEEVIMEHFIEEERKEAVKRFYENNPHIGIEIFADEIPYVYRSCKYTRRYKRHKELKVVYGVPDEVWDKKWIKVLLIGEKDELDAAEKDFRENYDNNNNCFRSGANYLDVVANGVSKGQALKELAASLNIDKEKVVAVGDNMNDVEMIETAKYGFCVKNGLDEVKEKADFIAPSNNNHAIAYIVDWIKTNKK